MSPQFHTHLWEGKKGGRRGNTKTSSADPNPKAPGALFSETSSRIEQPRHSWRHPWQASKMTFRFGRRPTRDAAHKVLAVCSGKRQDHTQKGYCGPGDEAPRWDVFTTLATRDTHLPVQTINSLFPKRASCWAELQSGSTVFLRPDTTIPSGVSLVFWGEFFTFFNFCFPFSGLKVPLLMNWGLSSRDLVWPDGPSIPRASPAEEAR